MPSAQNKIHTVVPIRHIKFESVRADEEPELSTQVVVTEVSCHLTKVLVVFVKFKVICRALNRDACIIHSSYLQVQSDWILSFEVLAMPLSQVSPMYFLNLGQ